ncbi:MAG: hypothetical protein AB1847_10895 [bacterium]
MSKRFLQIFIILAAIAAMAGSSVARNYEINLYGASAQYLVWNEQARDFLQNVVGCTGIKYTGDGKLGITMGTKGADTYIIRYTAKASYDGIYACKGQVPPPEVGGQPSCSSAGPRYRDMIDESLVSEADWADHTIDPATTPKKCCIVTVGASDVAGETFSQYSEGQLKGHLGGGWVTRNLQPIDTTGLIYHRPLVVPFGFFANNALAYNPSALHTEYDPNNVTNLTRLQAVLIFSGQASMWTDFCPWPPCWWPIPWPPIWWPRHFVKPSIYPEKYIVRCMRHAGSGTHATLHAAVMRGDWPLVTSESESTFFNDGSSDMMKCIEQNAGYDGEIAAAVGYADADQGCGPNTSYPTTYQLTYQGAPANKYTIALGVYDFWSAQWLYECYTRGQDTALDALHAQFFTYADSHLPASKANFWANKTEMTVEKATDWSYPGRI